MPTIIFNDGRTKKVPHSIGAKIFQILEGNMEPEDEKQERFVETVASVTFEPIKTKENYRQSKYSAKEPDMLMRAILQDPNIRGRDKIKAVAKRLKTRNQE